MGFSHDLPKVQSTAEVTAEDGGNTIPHLPQNAIISTAVSYICFGVEICPKTKRCHF